MASIYGNKGDAQIVKDGILLAKLIVQGVVTEDEVVNGRALDDGIIERHKNSNENLSFSDFFDKYSVRQKVWKAFVDAGGDDTHSGGMFYCVKQSAINVLNGFIAVGGEQPYTKEQAVRFLTNEPLSSVYEKVVSKLD